MIRLIKYNETQHQVISDRYPQRIIDSFSEDCVNWLDLEIRDDSKHIEQIATHFGLHHLTCEDILSVGHLPKFEEFDNYVFITLKMLKLHPKTKKIIPEHLSIILGENFVLTFQESIDEEEFQGNVQDDVFNDIRHRIANSIGRVRKNKANYLFYRLIDSVVDNYLLILESLREQSEHLEEKTIARHSANVVASILEMKHEFALLRRYADPLKSEIGRLKAEPPELIGKNINTYLQDVYDHLNQLTNSLDVFREVLKDLMDLYESNLSNRMNRTMQTLTIVSTIFIPLTFLAGIYGMNFKYMPELESPWGYPILLGTMALITAIMIIVMKRKRFF